MYRFGLNNTFDNLYCAEWRLTHDGAGLDPGLGSSMALLIELSTNRIVQVPEVGNASLIVTADR